jgi:hypothetical protein
VNAGLLEPSAVGYALGADGRFDQRALSYLRDIVEQAHAAPIWEQEDDWLQEG